jgi:hypothetical protein
MKKDKKYWKKRALRAEYKIYDLEVEIERLGVQTSIDEILKDVFIPTEGIPFQKRDASDKRIIKRHATVRHPDYNVKSKEDNEEE